jgi:hypothetical protein
MQRLVQRLVQVYPLPVQFTVRKAGERIAAPRVSRYTPLRLEQVSVTPIKAAGGNEYVITASFSSIEPFDTNAQLQTIDDATFLIDEEKQRHNFPQAYSFSIRPPKKTYRIGWHIYPTQYPAGVQKLEFRSRVSLDDSWPVDVTAVLWDKQSANDQPRIKSRPIRSTSRAVHNKR